MESLASSVATQLDRFEKLIKAERNYKKSPKERITRQYLETRIEILEDLWREFKDEHKSIIGKVKREQREKEDYFVKDVYDLFQDTYISYKSAMKETLEQFKDNTTANLQQSPMPIASNDIKLPSIQLPTFTGKYSEWRTFYDMFLSLIHNNKNLSPVQKLHYLKGSLSGEPEILVKNFSTTDSNYEEAWSLLVKRYDNKKYITNSIMQIFFSQKQITSESASAMKSLLDTTVTCLKSLNNAGIPTVNWDPIVVYFVTSKLDLESRRLWEHQVSMLTEDLPTWLHLSEFLESRFRSLEAIESSKAITRHSSSAKQVVNTKAFHLATREKRTSNVCCVLCTGNHYLCNCKQFGLKTAEERREFVASKRLCYNCLSPTHSVRKCRHSTKCRKCGRRHHSLIHVQFDKDESQGSTVTTEKTQHAHEQGPGNETQRTQSQGPGKQTQPTHIIANFSRGTIHSYKVLLATAVIKATTSAGGKQVIRALLDQGSQASFITEDIVQLLGLKRTRISGIVSGLGDGHLRVKYMVSLEIESRHNPDNTIKVNAYVVSKLTSILPAIEMVKPNWVELQVLPLADPNYTSPGKIHILLGAEVYSEVILSGVIKSPQGTLMAQNTLLGWVISGKLTEDSTSAGNRVISMHIKVSEDEMLRRFWEIESEPDSIYKKFTKEEMKCEEIYDATTTRCDNGRYKVRLPFSSEDPGCQYGGLRNQALKRLQYLERRLAKDPKLYSDYDKVLDEYLNLNHMELVDTEDIDNERAVYLPHHAVVKEDRETTKVRVVFDASCKGSNGVSLNDTLLVGPKLQQNLRHLLMRWRKHRIGIVADLVKMYRQVLVSEKDTNFQRIVWRSNPNEEIKHYKLLTLTFGTACAPYLAVKTLQRLAEDECENYPIAAEITKMDFYVDDLMTGAESESEAMDIYEEMNKLMKSGGFELQKWSSNSNKLLNQIGKEKHRVDKSVIIKADNVVKVLGISWNKETDNFEYTVNLPIITTEITKRHVLSDIARLYDPMGWIAPVVITAKIFIQKLWKSKLEWDDKLEGDILIEWMKFREELTHVRDIIIPRWFHFSPKCKIELHAFSDASQVAYAGAVYVRVIDEYQNVNVHLVSSKTKVAPIEKQLSVPRLELSAAALASKLLFEIAQVMGVPKSNYYAWTDSTVVLSWLKGPASRWTTFVSNRVSEILNILDYDQWGHVSTNMNPSDCASRGIRPVDLKNFSLWWNGPAWLSEFYVNKESLDHIEDTNEEERLIKAFNIVDMGLEELPWERFSSLNRLLQVLSLCRRVLQLRLPKSERKLIGSVTVEERKEVLEKCIKQVQEKEFKEDIQKLKSQGYVSKKSVLHTLCPFIDDKGILRVGGRIELAKAEYQKKHPAILPAKDHFTGLVIADAHNSTLHGGPQLMLNYLRGKYWIIRARDQVKKYYRSCVRCLRFSRTNQNQLMGQLPEARLKPSKPFLSSGVDYAGPVQIKCAPGRGYKSYKGYICLFVCMITRAVHIEAVTDLTAKGFIAAFRRFTSRRGHCKDLFSDNGTNFVGADKLLRDLFDSAKSKLPTEICQMLTLENTTWHFIPPHAPNFGGLWEAGVRSVKNHLKRVIGEATLTYEELATVLTQVESCLNSRPLSVLSDDPNDPLPLTPGHFLIGEPTVNIADDVCDKTISGLERWQLVQKIVNSFWKRWSKEYLVSLSHRYKWNKRISEPNVNDVVVIKEDNLPPTKWALGLVVDKHAGPDNIIRVVTLKCKNSLIKRPVSKICVLTK